MAPCEAGPGGKAARPSSCEVLTSLAHANPEAAVAYEGEATWQWRGGTRRVSFQTHCSTAADGRAVCDDPVGTWHD
jgi:hypothetical protein